VAHQEVQQFEFDPAQRQFAAKQLKGWVSDLRALAADG